MSYWYRAEFQRFIKNYTVNKVMSVKRSSKIIIQSIKSIPSSIQFKSRLLWQMSRNVLCVFNNSYNNESIISRCFGEHWCTALSNILYRNSEYLFLPLSQNEISCVEIPWWKWISGRKFLMWCFIIIQNCTRKVTLYVV